jgi:hypothetical protein
MCADHRGGADKIAGICTSSVHPLSPDGPSSGSGAWWSVGVLAGFACHFYEPCICSRTVYANAPESVRQNIASPSYMTCTGTE